MAWSRGFHDDIVFQLGCWTNYFFKRFVKQLHIVFFQPFIKELARDLNCKHLVGQTDGFDWLKPGFVALRSYIVFDDCEAFLPRNFMCLFVRHFFSLR